MILSSVPTKIDIVWARDAGSTYVLPVSDTVQQPTFPLVPSFPTGFPPANFVAPDAGGGGIDGRYLNGILQQLSAWSQWQAAGGAIIYDGTFQSSIGGYASRAIVCSATTPGVVWVSTADSNTTNPDASGAGWVNFFSTLTGGNNAWTGTNSFSGAANFTGAVSLGASATAATAAANSNNTGVATNAYADRAASAAESGAISSSAAALAAAFAARSLAGSGFQEFDGGLLLQWGGNSISVWAGISGGNINFPTSFPNACLSVFVCQDGVGTWSSGAPSMWASDSAGYTTTHFPIYALFWSGSSWVGPTTALGVRWFAIGF